MCTSNCSPTNKQFGSRRQSAQISEVIVIEDTPTPTPQEGQKQLHRRNLNQAEVIGFQLTHQVAKRSHIFGVPLAPPDPERLTMYAMSSSMS